MIKFYNEIENKNSIEVYLPFTREKDIFEIPNSYYINPNGYLFNTFGNEGHKETSLVYTLDKIKDFYNGVKLQTLEGEYTIDLNELLKDELITFKRIISTNEITERDTMYYLHMKCSDLKDPLLVKLILGIITSKIVMLERFISLNKKEFNKVLDESYENISDILVRFCGFHKIESQLDKTITTSSLDYYSFIEYFERGYKIYHIPGININGEYDDFYDSLVYDRFIEKYPEYEKKLINVKRG